LLLRGADSGAQKMPAPPASGHISQTSMHKKSKDSKNSSSAVHLNSKTAEEKKAAPGGPGEETDRPGAEPSSEATKPGNTEDGKAENSDPEKTGTNPTERRESAAPPETEEEGETPNKDCEDPGPAGSPGEGQLQ